MDVMSADRTIREVRAEDWPAAKELRLAALRDPLAPLAFMETYERAEARPDAAWRERTVSSAAGGPNRQFVAEVTEGPGTALVGTVTVLLEEPGTEDFLGGRVEHRQAHLVAVFVRPEHRGGGLAAGLFRAAVGWARGQRGVCRVRLFVHVDNGRAQAFYRKAGFVQVGVVGDEYEMEYRAER
ncbi:GNAT family N-acetyltransferase [Streptomyces boluensis]|uniref:GNAT family N-acetyltransferase n=1 Tax=Streptomyces boluensis TaxID=1775135 RepID=A0A964XMN5_9ACTN|nr:GNAT family N-acetyltransferase [Streptomyces boluensis]NBE53346.1 GNAT family N-acetyltransferase [Streptomyces boluensis]